MSLRSLVFLDHSMSRHPFELDYPGSCQDLQCISGQAMNDENICSSSGNASPYLPSFIFFFVHVVCSRPIIYLLVGSWLGFLLRRTMSTLSYYPDSLQLKLRYATALDLHTPCKLFLFDIFPPTPFPCTRRNSWYRTRSYTQANLCRTAFCTFTTVDHQTNAPKVTFVQNTAVYSL